jgi:hypothetical protein
LNPSTPPATIQAQIDKVYATQRRNNVHFHDRFTVALGRLGEISNVINNTGGPRDLPGVTPKVTNFPWKSASPPNCF